MTCRNANYVANKEEVATRNNNHDYSASMSYYLSWNKDEFRDTMMKDPITPRTDIQATPVVSESVPITKYKVDLQYSKLQKSLDSGSFKEYRIAAILDYLLLTYLQHDPDFTVRRFSRP